MYNLLYFKPNLDRSSQTSEQEATLVRSLPYWLVLDETMLVLVYQWHPTTGAARTLKMSVVI